MTGKDKTGRKARRIRACLPGRVCRTCLADVSNRGAAPGRNQELRTRTMTSTRSTASPRGRGGQVLHHDVIGRDIPQRTVRHVVEMVMVGHVGVEIRAARLDHDLAQQARLCELVQRVVDRGERDRELGVACLGVQRLGRKMAVAAIEAAGAPGRAAGGSGATRPPSVGPRSWYTVDLSSGLKYSVKFPDVKWFFRTFLNFFATPKPDIFASTPSRRSGSGRRVA